MSSLHIINRATKNHCGNGLPFYNKLEYVFANHTAKTDVAAALWVIPRNKMFTTQLELDIKTFVSFKFLPSSGGVPTGAAPFVFAANPFNIFPAQKNGNQVYYWETEGFGTMITPPPVGRWIAELICSDLRKFYSEEFITTDCF